ncbi:MAG: hypothetical protein KKA79_07875 [Nanoarchaeota archaeon]|nr:hypothetical protein [Nanoarchaeota archaeon]MCG2718289.1 hypothetical protein [Nanoarchaeota archaeon]
MNTNPQRKKPPVKLNIQTSNGVEVRKKFATSKVIRFGVIIYAAFLLRMCLFPGTTTRNQPTEPVKANHGIEYVIPLDPDIYSAQDLEINKSSKNWEVTKDGMPIGYLTEAYVLIDNDKDVIGFITNNRIYNSLGIPTANITKDGNVYDMGGHDIGDLKVINKTLDSLVDNNDERLARVDGKEYVILSPDKNGKNFLLTGIVTGYDPNAKDDLR